ncbi:MAG: UDP-N-acetylmuramoyl-L-alanyl-D-glutamate--2,6-diaminopimelate ligase [Thermosulfidibacteraceae bacterium]|jgi:UDP-N-acetylmuramoyl-L-alanyl-D-glutamate--2,6-diaminopimelate ligase
MKAFELLNGIDGIWIGDRRDFEVFSITDRSKEVSPGSIFVCIRGEKFDGHEFAHDAIERGASLLVVERKLDTKTPQFLVGDTKSTYSMLLSRYYGAPEEKLLKVAVTGTNGKTTIATMIKHVEDYAANPFGLIGTIYYCNGKGVIKASNTTPSIKDFYRLMNDMVESGLVGFSAEVSSHALKQRRIGSLKFNYAIFTNLTRDHLDYHKSMEDYFFSKSLLFTDHLGELAIVNADDPYGRRLLSFIKGRVEVVTYGVDRGDIRGVLKSASIDGMVVEIDGITFKTRLVGFHNLYNILAVYSYGIARRIDRDLLVGGISSFGGVRGRLERIKTDRFIVFIDYAHTPDALRNVLSELGKLKKNRLIVVFGCGGDRDRGKRPEMGKIATTIADYSIITSDNPRSEDPMDIIRDIVSGCVDRNYTIVVDRREAIKEALRMASDGDIILIAGKGHEDYQILKDRVIHFDDREVVLEILREMDVDVKG